MLVFTSSKPIKNFIDAGSITKNAKLPPAKKSAVANGMAMNKPRFSLFFNPLPTNENSWKNIHGKATTSPIRSATRIKTDIDSVTSITCRLSTPPTGRERKSKTGSTKKAPAITPAAKPRIARKRTLRKSSRCWLNGICSDVDSSMVRL